MGTGSPWHGNGEEKKRGKLGWEMSWDVARNGVQGENHISLITDTNCCSQSGKAASPNPIHGHCSLTPL